MRTNIFVIGVEVGLVESYGGGKRVKAKAIMTIRNSYVKIS